MDIFSRGVSMIWSYELIWNAAILYQSCPALHVMAVPVHCSSRGACGAVHVITAFVQVSSRQFQIVRGLGCVPLLEAWEVQASLFIAPAYTSACPGFAAID
jgi:hypothetical protein